MLTQYDSRLGMKRAHYMALRKKIFNSLDKVTDKKTVVQKGLSSMERRWGIYWGSGGAFTNAQEYQYLTDNHIDTALKRILQDYLKKL